MWDEPLISKKRKEFFDDATKKNIEQALDGAYGLELIEETNDDEPYIEGFVLHSLVKYNPNYGDNRICVCGDPYYRHFDSYENNAPVGCKYCPCSMFVEKKNE